MIKDRKEAIMFIANKRHGSMDDLVGMIGENFFNQFCRMGFIKKGVTKTASEIKSTWQLTKLSAEQQAFYREPNYAERSNGYCFYSLGV